MLMQVHGKYEWDEWKAAENLRKHGVAFQDAEAVFDDPYAQLEYDWDSSSEYEDRFRLTGRMLDQIVVVVSHTTRGERTRLISARKAEKWEVEAYYDRFI